MDRFNSLFDSDFIGRGDRGRFFTVGKLTFYMSYSTLVGFEDVDGSLYVSENLWSTTTGRHLNSIDGGDKKNRLKRDHFEKIVSYILNNRGLI